MTDGIGHSRSASTGYTWRDDIEVTFNDKNCDSSPGERLSFAQHFREIFAHNKNIILMKAIQEATPGTTVYNELLEQLSQHKEYIAKLIRVATERMNTHFKEEDRAKENIEGSQEKPLICRGPETKMSDIERLQNLNKMLEDIQAVTKALK